MAIYRKANKAFLEYVKDANSLELCALPIYGLTIQERLAIYERLEEMDSSKAKECQKERAKLLNLYEGDEKGLYRVIEPKGL